MGTYNDAINGAHRSLNDSARTRYPDTVTFEYAKDAIREIAVVRPDMFTVRGVVTCIAGVEQSVAPNGLYVVDVIGVVNGRAVTKGDHETLRRHRRNWRDDPAGPCENWFPLLTDQTKRPHPVFFIYPPAPPGQVLQVQMCMDPFVAGEPANANVVMPIDAQLLPAVESYIIFRCEMADDEHVVQQRAQAAYTNFATIIGADEKASKTILIEGRPQ